MNNIHKYILFFITMFLLAIIAHDLAVIQHRLDQLSKEDSIMWEAIAEDKENIQGLQYERSEEQKPTNNVQ